MIQTPTMAMQMPVQFRLESPVNADEIVLLVQSVLPLREENFHLGQRGSGAVFDPDFDVITKLMVAGVMRWITARHQGKVIGLQQWALTPHLWSRNLMLGICDSIIGGRKRGIDIKSFVAYGVHAMRAVGAHRVYYSAPVGSSFERVLEGAGARRLDIVMEMP
jgi:hypothetical protein